MSRTVCHLVLACCAFAACGDSGGTGSNSGSSGGTDAGPLPPPPSNRVDIPIDDGWTFIKTDVPAASAPSFDDSTWDSISLPHTWNVADGETPGYYRGPGWYRRHCMVPAMYSGRKLYLQFDAASKVADVWVNGTMVGEHRGGNAIFRFDVTSLFNVGADNVVAVKVDNSDFPDVPPLSGDFTQYGGLYRDVHLLVTDPVHVDVLDYASPGVFVTPKNVGASSADLDVRVELVDDDTVAHVVDVEADVLDATGAVVQTVTMPQMLSPTAAGMNTQLTLTMTIPSPHLWNGRADPYLYSAQVLLKDKDKGFVRDAVSQPLGFRSFAIDPNMGFSLNGQYLDLHGVNRHQERQGLGWALTKKDHDDDMALINEIGATILRGCHYEHSQYWYDLADRSGIVVWAEVGLVNQSDPSAAFHQNARQQLVELIRQSYNHPAIVFWSLSNELGLAANPGDYVQLMMELNPVAHTEDPTRITTLADQSTSWDAKAMIPDAVGFNHYSGWYYGNATDIGPFVDSMHQAEPTRLFAISEYGAGSNIAYHSATPVAMDHTEEYQNYFHETHWQALSSRPFVWGKMIWAMFDFASSTRNEGGQVGINDKGLVTHDHKTRKDAFYFYKANWTSDPFVYITSRRWEPRPAGASDIKVYANTDSVELRLNGASLGSMTSNNHVFVWPGVMLVQGTNEVDAIGTTAGGSTYTDSVIWTGM